MHNKIAESSPKAKLYKRQAFIGFLELIETELLISTVIILVVAKFIPRSS